MKRRIIGISGWGTMLALLLAVSLAQAVGAAAPHASEHHEVRNFDARIQHNVGFRAEPSLLQRQAVDRANRLSLDLAVTYEPTSSAARTIYNRSGYLSNPVEGRFDAMDVAMDYVWQNLDLLGLSHSDLASFEVTDVVHSKVGGATHIYLRQLYQGLPLYNGQLQINVNRHGRVLSVNNAFLNDLSASVNGSLPSLTAADAILGAADHLQLPRPRLDGRAASIDDPTQTTIFSAKGFSLEPIKAQLMWLPIRQGDARLVWNFQVATVDGNHWYDMNVDARSGQIWTRFDWTNSGTYRVYPDPLESPDATTPLPPADARSLIVNPEDATASPNGWFTGGVMVGNNVHSCADANANNGCDTPEPTCSGTTCDFAIDLTAAPAASSAAAIANLFYWNNLIHDVQYQYGFDEAGGNFQENNFGNGGAGSDSVNADAQDGSGNCNANFATPTDGGNPRMQMFLCTNASPARDGDYDNGVIVHEYGHGISIRQVGGPGNSSCLNNTQQAGEGWSDWLALVYTAEASHTGPLPRGLGAYLFNATTTIRDLPYSTDTSVNNWTYESISGASVPHGVGSRWAQGAWEVYWALVDKWGFEGDLVNFDINDPNEAGNKRALYYINEGLKNTACSPTFVDNRDGIIQAATDSFGGEDVCDIWQAFADFGLGTDAVSGGSGSTSPTNGFSIPAACQCSPQPTADAGPDQVICQGDSATVGTPAQANNTYSWAPGGQTTAQITVAPAATTTYTVTATTAACGSNTDSATIFVDDGSGSDFNEDFEGDTSGWAATGLWHQTADSACATPGYSSAVNAFYYGQDASCDYATGGATTGTLTSPVIPAIVSGANLTFQYNRVVESFSGAFDQTQVEIISSSGTTTVFSLDSSNPSTPGWVSSGNISLSAFAGESIQVRFVFNSGDGVANNFLGWFVDDVVVTNGASNCTPGNTAPTVSITAPADGSSSNDGDAVTFTGSANDTEDGDISSSLSWTSSLDGAIGSGATFSTSALSVGTHTITASATDSGGLSGSDSISVTVNGVNTAPVVTITAPANGSTSTSGDSVTFAGTANDTEDGTISASLDWTSSLDGAIGAGGTFSTSGLSVGTHTITASVTDSGGLSGSASISITVTPAANTAPTVNITAPADGSSSGIGSSVTFSGTASDTEDGDLSGALSWTSSLDGAIGSGATFSTSALSAGTHTITASATDSGGLSGSDSISITVTAAQPVTVTFVSDAGQDGWVRESSENSGVGGASNTTGGGSRALRPGDATADRQYKVVVSFDTSTIPAGATVTAATLSMSRGTIRGLDAFAELGDLEVDINTGGFGGDVALAASDFQAAATATGVATMSPVSAQFQISSGSLNAAGLAAINLSGFTQMRLAFSIDDNDNGSNDYVGFYSGNNGNAARRPVLEVTYIP